MVSHAGKKSERRQTFDHVLGPTTTQQEVQLGAWHVQHVALLVMLMMRQSVEVQGTVLPTSRNPPLRFPVLHAGV